MEFSFQDEPIENFRRLFKKATDLGIPDANAMTLATCSKDGRPSARMVLFKGFLRNGITFYTNYEGRKAQEIALNPQVGLVFFWQPLEIQVRIEGVAEKMTAEESQRYFVTRPRLSQIGAWASHQSQEISSFENLESQVAKFDEKFKDVDPIPVPPYWGGYRIEPDVFEFWFGKTGRLHQRFVYKKQSSAWKRCLLSP